MFHIYNIELLTISDQRLSMFHNICLQRIVPPACGAFDLGCDWFMDVSGVWVCGYYLQGSWDWKGFNTEILQIHLEKFTSEFLFSWSEYDMTNQSHSRRKRRDL